MNIENKCNLCGSLNISDVKNLIRKTLTLSIKKKDFSVSTLYFKKREAS